MTIHLPRFTGACAAAMLIVASTSPQHAQSSSLVSSRSFTHPRLNLTVVATEVELPPGDWFATAMAPADALEQVQLVADVSPDELAGRRTLTAHIGSMMRMGQWQLQALFEPLANYARTHAGIGPKSFADLDRAPRAGFADQVLRSPWPEDAQNPKPPPYLFLVPGARIQDPNQQPPAGSASTATPIVLELRPYLDDGRHWVLMSNGVAQRVEIDRALLSKYKLTINPVRKGGAAASASAAAPTVRYAMLALRRSASTASVRVTLADAGSGERRQVQWTLVGGKNDPTAVTEWAMARAAQWMPLASQAHAPVLQAWLSRADELYGSPGQSGRMRVSPPADVMQMGREPRTTSVFDILGGRAALRETLQLEMLRTAASGPFGAAAASVPISTLKGVDVRGMPFGEMLRGRTPGALALADRVPEDRLFVYFAKPSAVFPFLSEGGNFLARTGSTLTATAFDDNLKARYLRRLGLPEESSKRFLESGAVRELALVAPDLFLLEGTDLTLLLRVSSPDVAAAGLKLAAGIDVPASGIVERRQQTARPSYWARSGDVFYVGTSRSEIERMLGLAANPAASLGRSAELRYMLSEVAPTPATRALIYLSDPFIRRMVGPAVKIAQLRRMRAAADMTMITAGAMLRALDGQGDATDVATLARLGYIPRHLSSAEYVLQPDFTVVSRTWGSLADLNAIDTQAIRTVTQDEADAYTAYMEEYREYWRQFFDPIVMRLDDAAEGTFEMTTFILPLVDSQLYSQVQSVIETAEKKTPLRVPVLTPAPVMQVSLNLSDESWVGLSSGLSEMFSQYTGISPEIFDLMGPGLHIAIQDADPVISLGTSDLLGAFGGASVGARFDMLTPFALSVLTRPSRIMMELQDAPRALAILRRAAQRAPSGERGMPVVLRQIEGRDAWMYTIGVPGLAVLRLGLEIENGFLVITNSPWSTNHAIARVDTRALNGAAVQVSPDAVRLGLAALFATQAEHDQQAALASLGSLLPFLYTGSATPEAAATRHTALFGSTPLHPGKGSWLWQNGQLESSHYGGATRWKVPAFTPELGDFGLFSGATAIDLNMRLEAGGLRATVRWRARGQGTEGTKGTDSTGGTVSTRPRK